MSENQKACATNNMVQTVQMARPIEPDYLLDSDCPFYISYIDFWHNGPKNDVLDPDRGDKAPTFDPDTDQHHIGLSVRWTAFRVH